MSYIFASAEPSNVRSEEKETAKSTNMVENQEIRNMSNHLDNKKGICHNSCSQFSNSPKKKNLKRSHWILAQ